jgi:Zn-dependent peptidase ImmA (M78 family)
MEASRLHVRLASKERMREIGGSVDVFALSFGIGVPLLLRPLKGLLGAFFPEPMPGILVTTERSLSIQRLTAAHELGHYCLKHQPSLDDENVLRRMAASSPSAFDGPQFQEVEADAFAVSFLMPRWLIDWHCQRQVGLRAT